jgi:hypothetical protein
MSDDWLWLFEVNCSYALGTGKQLAQHAQSHINGTVSFGEWYVRPLALVSIVVLPMRNLY